jgi:hypothetical protein
MLTNSCLEVLVTDHHNHRVASWRLSDDGGLRERPQVPHTNVVPNHALRQAIEQFHKLSSTASTQSKQREDEGRSLEAVIGLLYEENAAHTAAAHKAAAKHAVDVAALQETITRLQQTIREQEAELRRLRTDLVARDEAAARDSATARAPPATVSNSTTAALRSTWACRSCTYENEVTASTCAMCGTTKPANLPVAVPAVKTSPPPTRTSSPPLPCSSSSSSSTTTNAVDHTRRSSPPPILDYSHPPSPPAKLCEGYGSSQGCANGALCPFTHFSGGRTVMFNAQWKTGILHGILLATVFVFVCVCVRVCVCVTVCVLFFLLLVFPFLGHQSHFFVVVCPCVRWHSSRMGRRAAQRVGRSNIRKRATVCGVLANR